MTGTKEYKNDNITVSLLEEPGCIVKLDISVTSDAAKAAFQKALKAVNKEVSIPGFRKGKAPNDLILTHYKKHVEDEWKDVVLNTAFSEALELVKRNPHNQHAVKKPAIKSMSKDEGSRFTIEFETSPIVPEIHPSELTLPTVSKKEVKDEDVVDFIEQLRLRMAEWKDVEDRGVQEGDFVDLDIESLDEPGLVICENTRFSVSDKTARWMYDLLIGAQPGAVLEGTSKKDNQESTCDTTCTKDHKHDEFKPTRCRVTVKSIKKPVLPEIDDEFIKKTAAESIEKLHENVRKKLEKDAEEEKNDSIKENLKKQIEEKYLFEIPKSYLSSEDPGEYAQLRLFFLAKEFAAKHKINVTNNDVYNAAMHEVMTRGELAEDLMGEDERRTDSARAILYTNLLVERALSKLLQLLTENSSQ